MVNENKLLEIIKKIAKGVFDEEYPVKIYTGTLLSTSPLQIKITDKMVLSSAFLILSEWYNQVSKPLMVIKGYGGIGKTTLVKYFLDDLFNSNQNNNQSSKILFIDSKEILDEISKQSTVNNVYDFYNALAKEKNLEKKLGKELLELSVDNGNLLIVLDGIDEVIAKLVSKFDIENFINTIYNNYSLGNEKTKNYYNL